MHVSVNNIVNSYEELTQLFNTPMKATVALYISSVVNVASKEKEEFDEKKISIIHELGEETTDEEGNTQVSVTEDNMEEFYKRIDELVSKEVFVCEDKIDVDDLVTANGDMINITPLTISKLTWLIREKE